MNLSQITGVCLDTIKIIGRPSTLIGTLLILAFFKTITTLLKTHFFEKRLVRADMPKTVIKLIVKHGLAGRARMISDKKPLAFCLGFFWPSIYLSTGLVKLMNHDELETVILHEKYHLMKKDNLALFVESFFKVLFFPFPMLSDLIDTMVKSREIKADRYAAFSIGNGQPIASAFKKLLRFDIGHLPVYSSAFTSHRHFESRIHALFEKRSFTFSLDFKNILISVFSLAMLVNFFFTPWQKVQADSHSQRPLVCLKGNDCSKHC